LIQWKFFISVGGVVIFGTVDTGFDPTTGLYIIKLFFIIITIHTLLNQWTMNINFRLKSFIIWREYWLKWIYSIFF